jgi:methionyl-tRNA synthetase
MKPTIQFADFEKIEFRIGQVIEASAPEWSNKLLDFKVDFGPEIGTKTILSGVRQWYSAEDFLNKKYPFIVNLAERKMGEGVSQGMMFMADAAVPSAQTGEGTDETPTLRPVVLPLDDALPNGSVLR